MNFWKKNPGAEPSLKRLLTLRLALVPAEGESVRRPARLSECTAEEWALAEQLADNRWRLVVISRRESDGEVRAELAHEALLRAWPRLEVWLRDERDFLVFKSDVERVQRLSQRMTRDDKALLNGLDLNRAAEWLPKRGDDLSDDVRKFVSASIERDRAAKRRTLRNQRRVTAGAMVAAMILAVVGGVAILKWSDAEAQRQIAEEHNADAMLSIGLLYNYGIGLPQDYTTAHEWYEKAAAKDNARAMLNIGLLYSKGQGIARDYTKAREWYEKAAAKGDSDAMVNIGELYANGYGVPRDDIKARDWRKKAAVTIEQKGSNDASKLLGLILAAAPGGDGTADPIFAFKSKNNSDAARLRDRIGDRHFWRCGAPARRDRAGAGPVGAARVLVTGGCRT
jgi:TPR repeat protein